jgi:hypothetical protein
MAFNNPLTKTQNYVFGRGVAYFAEFDANGRPMGERDLGNVPGLTLNVASETAEHFSSRSGIAKKDLTVTISVAFNSTVEIEDFSAENLALFLGGSVNQITQAATPVTNEVILNLRAGREYQLGATGANPTGVRGVSAVAVRAAELTNAVARANTTAYAVGDIYKSTTDVFLVTTAGTSAGSAPAFVTTSIGAATTDGTAIVKYLGTTAAFTVTTDYLLSADAGRFGIEPAATLGQACTLYTDVTGGYLTGSVDYTPAANTRQQITSTATGSVAGQFRFVADNAKGENRDLFISSASLAPNGDLPFITGNEVAKAAFELGVNERDTSTPLVIIDGRPVTA